MLALAHDYDYLAVVHLLGEAKAGWAIVATFLALLALH